MPRSLIAPAPPAAVLRAGEPRGVPAHDHRQPVPQPPSVGRPRSPTADPTRCITVQRERTGGGAGCHVAAPALRRTSGRRAPVLAGALRSRDRGPPPLSPRHRQVPTCSGAPQDPKGAVMTLEHELPGLLDELAADHDVGPAPLRDASDLGLVARHHQHSSVPRVLAVAACAGLVVGGLVLISSRSDPDRASGNEPSAPDGAPSDVVLAPSPSGPVELLSVRVSRRPTKPPSRSACLLAGPRSVEAGCFGAG